MQKTSIAAAIALAASSLSVQAFARDTINIVGSSTVFPFATAVAENFGRGSSFKTPKIESTGTGGGIAGRQARAGDAEDQCGAHGQTSERLGGWEFHADSYLCL